MKSPGSVTTLRSLTYNTTGQVASIAYLPGSLHLLAILIAPVLQALRHVADLPEPAGPATSFDILHGMHLQGQGPLAHTW